MENEEILKAIYQMRCEQIRIAWLNPATRPFIHPALAFAAKEKICPIFHVNETEYGLEAFETVYKINRKCVEDVTYYIDKIWQNNPKNDDLTLLSLESHFHKENYLRSHKIYKDDIIKILHYCKLSDKFSSNRPNDNFYEKLFMNEFDEGRYILHNDERSLEDIISFM
jgi:hypothetical protein